MSARLPSCLRLCKYAVDSRGSFSKSLCRSYHIKRYQHPEHFSVLKNRLFNFSSVAEDKKPESSKIDEKETPLEETNQLNELNKTIEEITKQRDELNDKYKRALADGENLRKRLMKQIDDAKIYGIQSFCKDLLEVADVLGKATESVPKEEVTDKNPHLKSLYEGLIMTEAQLQKVFKRHGLVPLCPLNEKFDPNLHEALFQQEVEGKAAGTVIVVSKTGYKLHERVVRPALVGVAKG
ncbi:grpE protein homolog, mitochondrial isoform X2 [Halyomorpha halys]|nr:grpE protein homolog, mitochondrial [Halyomorpha halys]